MHFCVLGNVSIRTSRTTLPAGPPQQQAVLAALLLRAGRVVTIQELVDAVWGEESPDSAVTILRTYVWRLRRLLREAGDSIPPLESTGDGYRLTVSEGAVDAHCAEAVTAAAARERTAGRTAESSRLLAEAVGLWRGTPLAGVPGPFAERERSRLAELRLMLMEERFEHELLLGRHAPAILDLTTFTREHPLRERPYGFLMRALHASGRQADAIAVFERARQVLAEELGLDPGPELREAHARILAGDREAVRAAGGPVTQQVPPPPADFTGRSAEIKALAATLAGRAPQVVLWGMGGVGKSALAWQAARQVSPVFSGGSLYADLSGTGDPVSPGTVLKSWLSALGVPAAHIPAPLAERSALFRSRIHGQRVLIVVDNAADTAQIAPLLPGHDGAAIVITSRPPLPDLAASLRLHVEPLPAPEARDMVAGIVGAHRAASEPDATADLVRVCGNLPLALRISASRLAARPRWTIRSMVHRLTATGRLLGELRVGDLALSTVFDASFAQLHEEQVRALVTLAAVDSPDWTLRAAAAVLGRTEHDTERLLEGLTDSALIQSRDHGTYGFHALVAAYARDRAASLLRRPAGGDAQRNVWACECNQVAAVIQESPGMAPEDFKSSDVFSVK